MNACTHYVPQPPSDPLVSAWLRGEPVPNGPEVRCACSKSARTKPVIPCDVCGERPFAYITRTSTANNKLLSERRYCFVCAKEKGVLAA